ncbi:hypothetical protein BJ875DRAFT_477117 [Amylocarpus encephaloides]|uniref:Uncharacterized protein n=1 Tax=Amylocarpus encephaloides TaxID=45428 RepID=A0A9P7Y820_9HELO|nr:hypothetical protein BJ875DRAFT_477117 [Amylocarpus encephaloides]
MAKLNTFQMGLEGVDEPILLTANQSSSSSSSSWSGGSGNTSRTFGGTTTINPDELEDSYDVTSLPSTGSSSQLSSPALHRNYSRISELYDVDFDSYSSSSEDEFACPSSMEDHSLVSVVQTFLSNTKTPENAVDFQVAIEDIYSTLQDQDNPELEVFPSSKTELPLATETQICTAILDSSDRHTTKLSEEHLLTLATSHGNIMHSGTTDSRFHVWLQDQGGQPFYGWEMYAPSYALMAVRDSLEDRMQEEDEKLPEVPVLGRQAGCVVGIVRKKERFLNAVLKVPVKVLLSEERVRGLLRPVDGD